MRLERFNTFDGVMIRAYYRADKALFKHCAGDEFILEKDAGIVTNLLFIHGVTSIETVSSSSALELDKQLAK